MDAAQWSKEAAVAETAATTAPAISERKNRRKNDEKQLNCPRCNSNNTKFCYYNNYSLTQPRYFCKTCRRYWTEGGSLRNIPVGGGSRKNKRSITATSSSAPSSSSSMQNHPKFSSTDQVRDLNLRFQQGGGSGLPELGILRGGGMSGRQMGSNFMHEVFGLQELGLGFQVGAGGATDHDEGRVLFRSSAPRDGILGQNRGLGGETQGFWNGMMGGGGSW
ncbi:hypothetical protein KFK09_008005 [Dendrobium nobile]|uniref:Dof zinc finger protein n=1 Tax=Dendrobium nobile TaxID=94219 RepID=A0A8T3BVW8_DENNO|nr:hypothetical protein KFK09_008005 [Dendrobium nobile]